jgi:hypothetical protein
LVSLVYLQAEEGAAATELGRFEIRRKTHANKVAIFLIFDPISALLLWTILGSNQ